MDVSARAAKEAKTTRRINVAEVGGCSLQEEEVGASWAEEHDDSEAATGGEPRVRPRVVVRQGTNDAVREARGKHS